MARLEGDGGGGGPLGCPGRGARAGAPSTPATANTPSASGQGRHMPATAARTPSETRHQIRHDSRGRGLSTPVPQTRNASHRTSARVSRRVPGQPLPAVNTPMGSKHAGSGVFSASKERSTREHECGPQTSHRPQTRDTSGSSSAPRVARPRQGPTGLWGHLPAEERGGHARGRRSTRPTRSPPPPRGRAAFHFHRPSSHRARRDRLLETEPAREVTVRVFAALMRHGVMRPRMLRLPVRRRTPPGRVFSCRRISEPLQVDSGIATRPPPCSPQLMCSLCGRTHSIKDAHLASQPRSLVRAKVLC